MDLFAAMQVFVRVVELGTMSAAARDLDVGQPAVSERIERLERFLGTKLLMRNSHRLSCTEEGQTFYERSKGVLENVEETITSISRASAPELSGTVRIAAPHCFGEVVVPQVLMAIRRAYPRLNIELALNDNVVDLDTEGVDISLRLGPLANLWLVAHAMGHIGRALVASPDYLDRFGSIESKSDLAKHPFIRERRAFANDRLPLLCDDGTQEHGRIQTVMTTSHWRPMFDTIVGGGGIGVVQRPACAQALSRGTLVEILPQYTIPDLPVNVLVRERRTLPPRIAAVISVLKKEIPVVLVGLAGEMNGSS